MAIKKILTEPNKILRQVSKSVEKVTKEECKHFNYPFQFLEYIDAFLQLKP